MEIVKNKHKKSKNKHRPESEKFFYSVFQSNGSGICVIDEQGFIVRLNDAFARMVGYSVEELTGEPFEILLPVDEILSSVFPQSFKTATEQFSKKELKLKRKNGTYIYVFATDIVVTDENGHKHKVITAVDISERMQSELIRSVLLNISNEATVAESPEDIYDSVQNAISQLIPIDNISIYEMQKINGTGVLNNVFLRGKIKNNQIDYYLSSLVMKKNKALLYGKKEIKNIVSFKKINGEKFPESFIGVPLKSKKKVLGVLSVQSFEKDSPFSEKEKKTLELIADQVSRVIERKNYEEELKAAKERAEELSNMKSEFLSQISHEVRTPLSAILSFSSLLENELQNNISDELRESFDVIKRSSERLRRTIELMLNASQVKNKKYDFNFTTADLVSEIINPVVSSHKSQLEKQNLELIFNNELDKCEIVCDVKTVKELFSNIIDNAIKYTKNGKIEIRIFKNETGNIQVDIHDTGIGISDKYLPHIYDIFSQEESGYTRSYDGVGLGLTLVKEYAEINNIELNVKSKKNKGTTFSLIFK